MLAHFFLKIYGKGFLTTRVQRWEKSMMELRAVGCTNMRCIRVTRWRVLV